MSDLRYTLGLDGQPFDATVNRSVGGVGRLGGALAALGATAFAGSFIQRGLEFNKTMGDSEAAIAKVLAQFQGLNDTAAKGEAAKAMAQLVELEPKAAGSLTTLVDGFLSTLASSQAAGLSVQQNIDLVGRFANAMGNANIPTEQLGQEMRSIVTANIGADSSLARILGITNEMITQARASGDVYGFLVNKIGKMGEAGDTAAVAFSSLQSAIDKAAGALTKPLFDKVLAGAKDFTAVVDELNPKLQDLGAGVGNLAEAGLGLGGFFMSLGDEMNIWWDATKQVIDEEISFQEAYKRSLDLFHEGVKARREELALAKSQSEQNKKTTQTYEEVNAAAGEAVKGMDEMARAKAKLKFQNAATQNQGEMALLRAQAAGQDKKAAAIEREMRIRAETLRIMEAIGASEKQAREQAEQKIRLEERIERRKSGGRSKIGGVTEKHMMGGESGPLSKGGPLTKGGGLDGFDALQKTEDYSREKSLIPGKKFMEPRTTFVPKFGGSLSARAAERVGAAVTPTAAMKREGPNADPAVSKLDKILGELTRIRTA